MHIVKVHYTFDKEAQVNCLARYPQTLNVQTIALDERNSIGITDLRVCVQAVTQCSPELAGLDHDYTIYARDFSEPDTPLVGQGMLSWALDSIRADSSGEPQMVTGRVTKNLLGVFGGGNKETLEVRLKLTEAAKVQRAPDTVQHMDTQNTQTPPQHQVAQQPQQLQQHQQPQSRPETALTPTGAAEWNSFIQSNPHIGQPTAYSRGASPALSQGPPPPAMPERQEPVQAPQQPSHHQQRPPPPPQPQHYQQPLPQQVQQQQQQGVQRVAPTPVDTTALGVAISVPASRPSSRASNSSQGRRKKPPTGRPRGRPRKKPADGSTSGYEDGTEGEDGGPAQKRAKITKVDKANTNPFGSGPDSLRVAASTSGSIRSFRPINLHEGTAASHLDEAPRAPTPVPQGPMMGMSSRGNKIGFRKESSMQHELSADQLPAQSERQRPLSPSQEDGRSPESAAPTPAYSDDSHMDIGSSPPVPRTASFMRSSPPPSSPVLPPMPRPETSREVPIDSDLNNLFEEESVQPNPALKAPIPAQPKPIQWRRTSSAVPMQVFRMEDGPEGQDMVHICNLNTPESALSAMPTSDAAPVMTAITNPLKQRPVPKKARVPQVPTPPPTTDSVENTGSPAVVSSVLPEVSTTHAAPNAHPIASTETNTAPVPTSNQLEQSAIDSGKLPGHQETPATLQDSSVAASTVALPTPTTTGLAQPPTTIPQPVVPPPKKARSRAKAKKLPQPQSENTSPDLPPVLSRSLSQPVVPQSQGPLPAPPTNLRRSASIIGLELPTPASESIPVGLPVPIEEPLVAESPMPINPAGLELPRPASRPGPLELPMPIINPLAPVALKVTTAGPPNVCTPSADCIPLPSSPTGGRSNKNIVKKHAIKQRLEDAIAKGELPQYCSNCGAIETPTWRKVWMEDRMGEPAQIELSSQPGRVTAIDILKYDKETERPTAYRLTKKSLAPGERDEVEGGTWKKVLLCNPCGIWLGKSLSHRPSDRWEKDADRLGQRRTKRVPGQTNKSRSRKRTKSDSQSSTFPAPLRPSSSGGPMAFSLIHGPETMPRAATEPAPIQEPSLTGDTIMTNDSGNDAGAVPTTGMGSTHSRGSGTAKSPATFEMDDSMGSTKRLLFPSPNKAPKTLGELDVNVVHISNNCRQPKELEAEKENIAIDNQAPGNEADDLEALFRSPVPPRPSTPTGKAGTPGSGFKTPTRPTPSQRPITRSISRSIRSWKVQKTPRGASNPPQTPTPSSRRRSPRNHDTAFGENVWNNTPVSRAISQMLSDNPHLSDPTFAVAEGFSDDLDFSELPPLAESEHIHALSSWFSTDGVMPATSPKNDNYFDYDGSTDALEAWHLNLLKEQAKVDEA